MLNIVFNNFLHSYLQCSKSPRVRCSSADAPVDAATVVPDNADGLRSPALKRFKLLSARISVEANTTPVSSDTPQSQINRYITEIEEGATQFSGPSSSLTYWSQRRTSYGMIADLAEDLLAAPASQAFVERVFSVCGLLTQGRRNRMSKSLEMRVCLKLNSKILSQIQNV